MTNLVVTNLSTKNITISSPVGVVLHNDTVSIACTAEAVQLLSTELLDLKANGLISFTYVVATNQSDAALSTQVMTADQTLDVASALPVGPFTVTLAATQTNTATVLGGIAVGYVVPRAGSITSLSVSSTAAPTTADVNFRVSVNGTPVAGTAAILTFSPALSKVVANFPRGTFNVVAGDIVRVVYTSGGIGNTPSIAAFVDVSC